MLTAITYGTYVAMALLCLAVYRDRFQRVPRVMLVVLPVILAGVFVSYTRSVWICSGLGLFIVMILTCRGRLRVAVLVSPVLVALLAPATLLDNVLSFQRDQYSAQETKESALMRAMFAHVSWRMFQDRPLVGVGFGNFAHEKLPYLNDRSLDLPLQAIRPLVHHNTLLSLLTETGVIGFLLFVALGLAWLRAAWEVYRSPHAPFWARRQAVLLIGALCGYLSQLAFHELSYSPLDNGLIFLLAGITVGLRPLTKPAPATCSELHPTACARPPHRQVEHVAPPELIPA
jgi:O-antigen ligase